MEWRSKCMSVEVTVRPQPAMLRAANSEDSNAIATVFIESRKAFLPFAPVAHTEEQIRNWARELLCKTGGVTVWQSNNQVVAFLAISEERKVSWIQQLYVLPGWTNQGIGLRLLEYAQKRLRRPIHLYTFQENSGARRFYERHGYKAIKFSDGSKNEEKCPDVLYAFTSPGTKT